MSTEFMMYAGFILAAYSVVGNDVIQTLGTFLSSNEQRPWYVLWGFAGTILTITLIYGWYVNGGDVSYGKLIGAPEDGHSFTNPAYPLPDPFSWWYLIPPVVLLLITRVGIPVSTTFLILSFFAAASITVPEGSAQSQSIWEMAVNFFNEPGFYKMLNKSLTGYVVAFGVAVAVYLIITRAVENYFLNRPLVERSRRYLYWAGAQWLSTGWLWTQWLTQDFANIYAYLPRKIELGTLLLSLVIILGMLAFIFYQRGGAIQSIVKSKTNTVDIRSATIIDFVYGTVLFFFKGPIPMSTTWVFIGLLAGREYAIQFQLHRKLSLALHKMVASDAGKATLGLLVSIFLVLLIRYLQAVG